MTIKIAIVGAGLMGRVLAIDLLSDDQHDYRVTLYDQDQKNGQQSTGFVAAGMLAPLAEVEKEDVKIYDWGMLSLQRWPQLITAIGADIWFQQAGSLIVAHQSDLQELQHLQDTLRQKLGPRPEFECLGLSALQLLEPELNPRLSSGLYFPSEGQLSSRDFFMASTAYLTQHKNCTWHSGQAVSEIETLGNYDYLIDCRGLGARARFSDLHGVRGEVIRLRADTVHLNRPVRLLHPRYQIYIVPRAHHEYVIGATSINSDDFSAPTVQSVLELLSAAYSVHAGFAEAEVIDMQAHCRPTLQDHLPRIMYNGRQVAVNGLYRHGYLIAPYLSLQIKQYLQSN